MKLSDLSSYDTVILYGMGINGKSVLNIIRNYVPNIICWDKNPGEYNGYKIASPPDEFSFLDGFGKYLVIVTPTTGKYAAEMVGMLPDTCNVTTLYSFEEYKAGFVMSGEGSVTERGYCPSCENDVEFKKRNLQVNLKGIGSAESFRVICPFCNSNVRQRATIDALNVLYPGWRSKAVHESSPTTERIKAMRLLFEGNGEYSYSYYYEDVPLGEYKDGARCENLERLTFDDESFDYIITTDVFEHINNPLLAFAEVGRVLKKGGAHVFTIPYNGHHKTKFRAVEKNGKLVYLEKPQYHGNPISSDGSLITVDWGWDIGEYIYRACGMDLIAYNPFYKPMGMGGPGNNVFVCFKA